MLLSKHRGGHQNRRLLPVEDTLHHGAECHLRLAVAHIAAEKAIHGNGALHIPFDLCSGAELILRLLVRESVLKLPLPRAVRGKGKASQPLTGGIELNKPLCQFLGCRLGAVGGLGPLAAP